MIIFPLYFLWADASLASNFQLCWEVKQFSWFEPVLSWFEPVLSRIYRVLLNETIQCAENLDLAILGSQV